VSCAGTALCHDAQSCDRTPLASLVCTSPVVQGTTTTLDASGSTDPDGDALSWRYTLPDGGVVDGGATLQQLMTTVGSNAFSVLVRDPAGASASASCSVSVSCAPESDAALCTRLSKDCGALTAPDNCGVSRSVQCGPCLATQVCGLTTTNVCGTVDPATIAAPRALTPMSLSTVSRPKPTFHWVLPASADGAQVELCPDRACATPTLTFSATGTSAVPASNLTGRVLFWRLRGLRGSVAGTSTSPVWQFTLRPNANGADVSWGQVPDVNNDGAADAMISAYQEPKTWFYQGGPSGLTNVGSVATGYQELESAGDVNGDGFADWLGLQSSAMHLFHGSATGVPLTPSQTINTSAISVHRIAGVGDINGDGYSDVARVFTPGSGVSFDLWLGTAAGLSTSLTQTFVISNTDHWYVGPAGDVNGDGFGDVAFTNCYRSFAFGCGGDVFVHLGSATGIATTAAWSITSTGTVGLSGPGDFNADGYADLAVSDLTTVSIYFGSATGLSTTASKTLPKTSGALQWGFALDFADLDGDGLDDLIVGDPGAEKATPFYAPSLTAGTAFIDAPTTNNHDLGSLVMAAGDVNRDGKVDVLVSAPNAPTAATFEHVWLFFGRSAGFDNTVANSQYFTGMSRNKQFGYSLR
jgi:hypothetical protein